jgi:ketosteroid isomerase-like protein
MHAMRTLKGMNNTHPTALELLKRHLEIGIVNNLDAWYALFNEDAILEFPYAIGTPFPSRLDGKAAIREHIDRVAQKFGRFTFRDARFHAKERDLASCEVHGTSTIASTGEVYEQNFVMVLEARDGRIARYREYWSPIVAMALVKATPQK